MSRTIGTRKIASLLIGAASAAVTVSGCFGSAHDGKDSETHFACVSNADCGPRGTEFECLRGICLRRQTSRTQVARSEAGVQILTAPEAGSDARAATVPPILVPHDAGAEASVPAASAEGGRSIPDAGPSKGLLPPFTMDIRVTGLPGEALPPNLRVALVWYPDQFSAYVTGRDASVSCAPGHSEARWRTVIQPATMHDLGEGRFTLEVTEPPPTEAMIPPMNLVSFPLATGQVVAYEDGNANGTLDFATPHRASADEIVGTSAPETNHVVLEYGFVSTSVEYLTEDLYTQGVTMPMGFSKYVADNSSVFQLSPSVGLVTAPITIALRRTPTVRAEICTDLCRDDSLEGGRAPASGCPATPLGLPKIGSTLCLQTRSDQPPTSFVWRHVICTDCECRLEQCDYRPHENGVPTPDWPCGTVSSWSEYPEP
jgi:hypothetical protein